MVTVHDSIRGALTAEFLNQFRELSPMTATEFGTLLRLVRDEDLHNFICHHIDRKGWIYHTRNGKHMGKYSKPRPTDTIHYMGPGYTFHKGTVHRIPISE